MLKDDMRSEKLEKKHKPMYRQDIYSLQKALEIIYSETFTGERIAHYASKTHGLVKRF